MNQRKDTKEFSNAELIQVNIICSVLFVSFVLLIYVSIPENLFFRYVLTGISCIIYILILTGFNWRCPDCRCLLVKIDTPPERCPRCGAQLDNMQSRLVRFINNIFQSNPTKDFPAYAPPMRIIFDIDKHRLNDIGFHDKMSAFKVLGPADETDCSPDDEGFLVYSKLGIAAGLDGDGVCSFEVVMDSSWEELPLKGCSMFYFRTTSGKEVHIDYKTNESELAEFLGEATDRTSLSNGDLQCLYDASGTFVTATFKNNGKSLRNLEFVEAV
jgi:hypothetical protein